MPIRIVPLTDVQVVRKTKIQHMYSENGEPRRIELEYNRTSTIIIECRLGKDTGSNGALGATIKVAALFVPGGIGQGLNIGLQGLSTSSTKIEETGELIYTYTYPNHNIHTAICEKGMIAVACRDLMMKAIRDNMTTAAASKSTGRAVDN